MCDSRIIDRKLCDAIKITTHAPTVAISSNLAKHWFDDVKRESIKADVGARRREILFTYCFLEAYIVEWAYVTLGSHNAFDEQYDRNVFLPSLKNKWIEMPKLVCARKSTEKEIQIDVSSLDRLKYFRDGLVHAKASRWFVSEPGKEPVKPEPSQDELGALEPGWAKELARQMVIQLHEQFETEPPSYIF